MRNEFTAIIERDGDGYTAYCPEVAGASGQGKTPEEARSSLAEAIALILEDRREDALRGVPADAFREADEEERPVTRGEGSSAKRRRYWGVAALLIAVGVLGGLVSRKKKQGWLAHRRGEGPSGEARAEIAPRPGDILLFHHVARLRDVLITMVTHSPFYHTALYAGDGHVIEARPQGVIYNHLRGREQNFVVIPAPEGKGEAALTWARGQLGAPFDRFDFLVIFLEHLFTHWHINYTPHGRYTCAELVVTAYQHAGVRLIPEKDVDEIAPADLVRLLPPAARLTQ
jgi:predicted RNase H-like HicB family nuclease